MVSGQKLKCRVKGEMLGLWPVAVILGEACSAVLKGVLIALVESGVWSACAQGLQSLGQSSQTVPAAERVCLLGTVLHAQAACDPVYQRPLRRASSVVGPIPSHLCSLHRKDASAAEQDTGFTPAHFRGSLPGMVSLLCSQQGGLSSSPFSKLSSAQDRFQGLLSAGHLPVRTCGHPGRAPEATDPRSAPRTVLSSGP